QYNVSVNVTDDNIALVRVSLLDSSFNTLSSNDDYVNYTSGSFDSLNDGLYYIYVEVTLNDSTKFDNAAYLTNFTISSPITIVYSDPTPLNGSLLNSNVNSLNITAVTNKITMDNFTIYLLDANGSIVNYSDVSNQSSNSLYLNLSNIPDGNYTFLAEVDYNSTYNATSDIRNLTIKRTLPNITSLSVTGLPSSITPNQTVADIIASFVPSEFLKFFGFKAVFNGTHNLGSYSNLTNLTGEQLNFTISNLTALGDYQLYFTFSDNYGNYNSVNISNLTVANPIVISNVGGGRTGGFRNLPELNNTNLTLPENTTAPISNQTNSTTPTFFSAITGAVTGALGSASFWGIIALVIVVGAGYWLVMVRRKKK
ncbi:MAG: hypothetical protein WCK29_04535, partial [archaeon]